MGRIRADRGDDLERNRSEETNGDIPIEAAKLRPHRPVHGVDVNPRETEILRLIAEGLSNKEIARSLDIGPETVKSHLKGVFIKLGVEKRAQAVSRAQTLGLVTTQ